MICASMNSRLAYNEDTIFWDEQVNFATTILGQQFFNARA